MGSINLSEFVVDPFTSHAFFNATQFTRAVKIAVRALDDVVEEGMNLHPLEEQRDIAKMYRNTGLGIMGLADMLVKLGMVYGSEESIVFVDSMMDLMFRTAVIASIELAQERGAFPAYDESVWSSHIIKNHFSDHELQTIGAFTHGIRNCSLLSIAPTGSLGTMLSVSTGCEPLFSASYTRKTESLNNGEERYYDVFTGVAKEYMNLTGKRPEGDLFVTAMNIPWKKRIEMQAVIQDNVDTAISSTVNLPNDCTLDQIEELYLYAWEQGLKGVTIFRDGCARTGILTTDKPKKLEDKPELKLDETKPITRDKLGKRLSGSTYVKNVACGKLYITINRDDNDNLVEVFIDSGKSGGCAANAECLGRYASAAMRNGMSIDSIVDITKGVKCSACTQVKGSRSKVIDGLSCGDVVARTIQEEYERIQKNPIKERVDVAEVSVPAVDSDREKCPDCGDELAYEGGCKVCKNCGWSKCD